MLIWLTDFHKLKNRHYGPLDSLRRVTRAFCPVTKVKVEVVCIVSAPCATLSDCERLGIEYLTRSEQHDS
jgi:hypothetical protein